MAENDKFDRNKILRYIKILHFDPKRHNSLTSALKEILESGRYLEITLGTVNGIQSDPKKVQEVNEIIEAYEYLKENKEQVFQDKSLFEDYSQKMSEVYVIEDNDAKLLKVMKRDSKEQEYQCVLEFNCKYHKIYSDDGYLFEYDNNIIKRIYNLQGEIILNIEEENLLEQVSRKSCRAGIKKLTDHLVSFCFRSIYKDKNKLYIIVNCATKEYIYTYDGELLQKVFYNDNISIYDKENLFYSVYNNLPPEYLLPSKDKYDKTRRFGMFNDYIWVYEKGNTTYYTVAGEKIISTIDGNYSYIQDGKVWDRMDRDIDEYKISCAEDNVIVVGKYNRELKILYGYYDLDQRKEIISPCSKEPLQWLGCCGIVFSPNPTIVDREGKRYSVDDKEAYIFQNILKIKELSDNFYVATYFEPIYAYKKEDQSVRYSYALMRDIFTKPKILGRIYDEMIIFDFSIPYLLVRSKEDYWRKLSLNGEEYNIVADNVSKRIETKKYKRLPGNMEIVPKIESSLTNYLLPEVIKNEVSRLGEELPCYYDKTNTDNRITEIKQYNQNGVLFLEQKVFPQTLLVNQEGKVMFTPDYIPFMDDLGNICIKNENESLSLKTLINSEGEILIPLKKNIDSPHNNLYIVEEENGVTLFDANGNQILGKFENLEWIEKYYVNEYGVVSRIEDKLKLIQNGYVTIADDEKEFFVKKNNVFEETLKKLVLVKKEISDDSI